MKIDVIDTKITTLDRPVRVRVLTPNGYENSGKSYPVLYVNDGQDVFRDDQAFWGAESLRFEQYYKDYGKFMPEIILVAIESPEDHALRTAQYSPYTKNFDVPPEKKFEPRIEGKGKEYLAWATGEFKPWDRRPLPHQARSGVDRYLRLQHRRPDQHLRCPHLSPGLWTAAGHEQRCLHLDGLPQGDSGCRFL